MKKTLSMIATTTVLGAASWAVFQTGLAAPSSVPMQTLTPAAKPKVIRIVKLRPAHHRLWRLGFHHDKRLNEQDAATITKAALIMRGKHNLNVGKIAEKPTRFGKVYLVNIVNPKNKVVKRIVVNSRNGAIRPLRLRHTMRA